MLKSKADYSGNAQGKQSDNSPENPSSLNLGDSIELTSVAKGFPVASDQKCCNSGITGSEVAGSNQSLTDEATLRQMLSLSPVSHEAGVSGGCGCCEGSDDSAISFQSERVFGVDSLYSRPVDSAGSKNIVDNNTGLTDLDTRVPKQQPSQIGKPEVNPGFGQNQAPGLCCQSNNSEQSEENSGRGHDSSRSGVQGVTLHPISLTQPATPKGACC